MAATIAAPYILHPLGKWMTVFLNGIPVGHAVW
jgi:hypothetical protein